ncbi:MAG: DUF1800 domain-containing protein [Pelomonas sp.]|nr:DUF1800 domain-containing protein [Roseateles sp.]
MRHSDDSPSFRPRLVLLAALVLGGCAAPPEPAPRPVAASTPAQDSAWLDRLSWGASSSGLAELQREGRSAWLAEQLAPSGGARLPQAASDEIQALQISQTDLPTLVRQLEDQRKAADALSDDDAKKAAQQAYQQAMNKAAREAATRELLLALYSQRQLQEQLTWFWFNHFNVHQYKSNIRVLVGDYEQGLREHALGRFRDLLGYTVHHPAMLRYLDNEQNAAGHINENYARELMELHTLGVGSGYTQRDVQELARVLTGLGVRLDDGRPKLNPKLDPLYVRHGLMEFNPARHDFGDKQVLGTTIRGRGILEIDQVLDLLARQPATARHVCTQLAQYFVADQPPQPLVDAMVQRWQQTDGQIAAVLRAMVESPAFDASLGRKFKDPMHYVVASVREAYDQRVVLNTGPMLGWLNRLAEAPFNRQTPDGYPMDEGAWAGPGQLNTRFEIARSIGSGSAGLFKPDGPQAVDQPAFPQLATPLYYTGVAPRLSVATRQALDQATSPQEWNALLLSSPELMHR